MAPREERSSNASHVDGGARTCRRRAEAASERARAQGARGGTSCASTSCGLCTLRGHEHELRDEVGDARRRRARCWGRRVSRRRGSGDRDEGRADRRRAENRCAISRDLRARCAQTILCALTDDGALALRRRRVGERAVSRRRGGRGRNAGRDRQRRAEAATHDCERTDLPVHVAPAKIPCQNDGLLRQRKPPVSERLASVDVVALSSGRSEWAGLVMVLYILREVRASVVLRLGNLQVVNIFNDGEWRFRRN